VGKRNLLDELNVSARRELEEAKSFADFTVEQFEELCESTDGKFTVETKTDGWIGWVSDNRNGFVRSLVVVKCEWDEDKDVYLEHESLGRDILVDIRVEDTRRDLSFDPSGGEYEEDTRINKHLDVMCGVTDFSMSGVDINVRRDCDIKMADGSCHKRSSGIKLTASVFAEVTDGEIDGNIYNSYRLDIGDSENGV